MPVNPGTLPGSAIETRIAEWDLVHIATAEGDGDDEHAYDAQNVAHNRSWDDLDLESTFEHPTRERPDQAQAERGSWEYEDAEFGDPERIEFDTEDLIDAAVSVYLNPRKSSPTIANPASGLPSRRSAAFQRRISVPRTQPSAKTTARLVRGLCSTRSETVLTARSPWLRSSIARSRTRFWVPCAHCSLTCVKSCMACDAWSILDRSFSMASVAWRRLNEVPFPAPSFDRSSPCCFCPNIACPPPDQYPV